MNEILSIIGTIASVGSVPLSIFLYLKSREEKVDKVKRDVVRILSHQIGEQRELTTFEIQTVINSKSRENKIDTAKITIEEIVEDLVSDTISNPLLDKQIKENIITELKAIYFKGKLFETIDELEKSSRTAENDTATEEKIKELILQRQTEELKNKIEKTEYKRKRLSESYAMIAAIMTLGATIFTLMGKERYDKVFSYPLYEFLEKNDFYIAMFTSIIAAVISSLFLGLRRKFKK
ncbi:hypothetical protein [Tenacibaculum finnmarkense]|uniref:hypothetical protein n=1 Tax=Tenacibaculum finnmarkense TaxID=2781243 RepID=UPI001E301BB1|nr:hypothetical protein [Tenacibaculum finnmarkense]MCD8423593.1 hypothetical protein [Tenacibaculum finnmarkense genomovar ulcerans]MCG8239733.1 hypothetical protein [Tenacibaculum finnmarkense genomovar ulcerans]